MAAITFQFHMKFKIIKSIWIFYFFYFTNYMDNKCKIKFLRDSDDTKYLPFQYYNKFKFVTIPVRGKIPFIKNWQLFKKTVHPSNVLDNIAVLTGHISKITVIDIDQNDNGLKFWNELTKDQKLEFPTVITPTGLHIYFKYTTELKNTIRLKIGSEKIGIDIRNNGGLAVLPPSSDYKWIKGKSLNELKLKKMPKWLFDFLKVAQIK